DAADEATEATEAETEEAEEAAAGAPETTDVVIAASALSGGLMSTFVADAQGFFEAEGLSAEVVPFQGAPAAIQGLITGEADVYVGGFNSLLALYGTPEQPVVFHESMSAPSFVFYGQPGIDSWQALADINGVLGNSSIGGMDYQL